MLIFIVIPKFLFSPFVLLDNDEFQLHGVLHQRLNYLSDFKFELFLHNQP